MCLGLRANVLGVVKILRNQVFLFCVLCAFCVRGASVFAAPRASDDPPHRDAAIESLIQDAAGLPPEFNADVLIRVAGSTRVVELAWKREMLEEAFLRAYAAPVAYRRTSVRVPPDSRQGALTQAYDTQIARVPLQVRSAQLMAFVAPLRARELFEWIDLNLAPAVCSDVFVPAVDEYYGALSTLARTTFTPSERGDALRFLELYLWRAHLPTEMPAVARALIRFRPSTIEATYLETLYRHLLEAGTSDPRGFSVADIDIVGRSADLQGADRERNVPGWFVMDALKAYLLEHLNGPRCADSATESFVPSAFNAAARLLHADPIAEVTPINADAIRPSRLLGGARIDLYWQTFSARRLYEMWMGLRGTGLNPVPERVRRTDEWRNNADRFITELNQWTGHGEASERDYFYQKATLFVNLIDLMPSSSVRVRGLRDFIDFMRHADTDRDQRALWFVFVNRLLELARGNNRRETLALMEQSGQATLSTYARLERMMPPQRRAASGASAVPAAAR
jgi:hypothetical protein